MRFVVHLTAMNGPEQLLNKLDAILIRVEGDVHVAELRQADQLEQSAWYRSSRADRQKLLQEIAKSNMYEGVRAGGPHLRCAEVVDEVSAQRAHRLAYEPLRVLLENDLSDRALVEAALRVYASAQTKKLWFEAGARLDPPAVEPESRGGHGPLKVLIQRRLKEATERLRPPRLVVVTDSDAEVPKEVKNHAVELRALCAAHSIPCPPLNKRTAENYIPDEVFLAHLAELADRGLRAGLEALLRLKEPAQRDHVRMDKTNTPPWDAQNAAAAALFQDVLPADQVLLTQASLKGRGDHFLIFLLHTHHQVLTPAVLEGRDHAGDLKQVVRAIEDEL